MAIRVNKLYLSSRFSTFIASVASFMGWLECQQTLILPAIFVKFDSTKTSLSHQTRDNLPSQNA